MLEIKVLGPGCQKCIRLAENVKQAVAEMNVEANIVKITDLNDIMSFGIMSTPGLVVNDKVVSYGKLINVADCKKYIEQYL